MPNEPVQNKPTINCAIYTRKSTSEGLDQSFTTLDAQRESAINFINSQKNEGWVAIENKYDDGGYTGANTDRPALQLLIEHIKAGKVNCVVVYKVDRLSRSLVDFVQLLELFEQRKVTFVSVTQAFNTNTSMGRLTLNILLSFAQFEREIISERTKDKMAAARKRGKWLGGRPPLGYDLDKESKKLTINPQEAKIIRTIYELYLKGYSLKLVGTELTKMGYHTKSYTSEKGKKFGDQVFQNTTLNAIIRNPLYIGKVKYGGELFDGQQEAIIDEDIYNRALALLVRNRNHNGLTKGGNVINPLTRILFCKNCNSPMFGTYTHKNHKTQYRYYVCSHAQKYGYHTCSVRSLNANEIENLVAECLFRQPEGSVYREQWPLLSAKDQKAILVNHVKRVDYLAENKKIRVVFINGGEQECPADLKGVRHGNIYDPKEDVVKEPKLRQLLLLAHHVGRLLESGEVKSVKQAAKWLNMSAIRLHLIMELLFISPRIQEEILLGKDEDISIIPEYRATLIAKEPDWGKQYDSWRQLLQKPTNSQLSP